MRRPAITGRPFCAIADVLCTQKSFLPARTSCIIRAITKITTGNDPGHMKHLLNNFRSLILLPLLLVVSLNVIAGPADLDPTFGNFGKVIISPDGSNQTWGNGIAVQADGKIVMTGDAWTTPNSIMVVRFNADGSPDSSFAPNGVILVPFAGIQIQNARVVIQADGKIVVASTLFTGTNPSVTDIAVARLNSNGSLDTSFDGDGKAIVDFNEV